MISPSPQMQEVPSALPQAHTKSHGKKSMKQLRRRKEGPGGGRAGLSGLERKPCSRRACLRPGFGPLGQGEAWPEPAVRDNECAKATRMSAGRARALGSTGSPGNTAWSWAQKGFPYTAACVLAVAQGINHTSQRKTPLWGAAHTVD